ncbi:2,4-diaminobutyrate 4-transaminase [Paenibacillus sp. JCM 10914]|nr:2,4-diaminobutyrate 4-transaminase [Paenibacillus sp. JCM 10914]
MAAGLATLRFIKEQELPERARLLGERLQHRLDALADRQDCIGDVRGLGLMVGVEIVDGREQPDRLGHIPASPRLAAQIQQECLKCGLILEVGGRHSSVIRFLPPLIITEEQVDEIIDRFSEAVQAAREALSC